MSALRDLDHDVGIYYLQMICPVSGIFGRIADPHITILDISERYLPDPYRCDLRTYSTSCCRVGRRLSCMTYLGHITWVRSVLYRSCAPCDDGR